MAGMTLDRTWPALFTPADMQRLCGYDPPAVLLRPRQKLAFDGDGGAGLHWLSSGFVGQYRLDRLGRRQCVGIHLPGDCVDLSGLFLGRIDHHAEALGPAEVRGLPRGQWQVIEAEEPRLLETLWRASMIEAAINRYWVYRIGRLGGRARIANFLCEMLVRLYARGLCTFDRFELPLTQTDLAEVSGMTAVHVNRMLSELRDEGTCTFTQGAVQIANPPELFHTGQYRWDYLYLDPDLHCDISERVAAPRRTSSRGA